MLPSIAPAWSPTVGFSSLNQSRCHRVLPFCYFTLRVRVTRLKALMLKRKGMVESPKTLGEHLRNRRLVLGLTQEDVALQLSTMREVYERWERDFRMPVITEWPGILQFLGYYPFCSKAPSDLVLKARRCLGAEQTVLAIKVGVIHQKLRCWENGKDPVPTNVVKQLRSFANLGPSFKP
jgi:DNA-binding XRE family transcriptional regulator